jgi:hypothetical protein
MRVVYKTLSDRKPESEETPFRLYNFVVLISYSTELQLLYLAICHAYFFTYTHTPVLHS